MSLFQLSASDFGVLKSTPKTIIITGGSSGIGLATASLLSTLNPAHNLVLLDLQPPPPSFSHAPSRTLYVHANVTSWTSQREAFEKAYARFGRIDAVFVNAGITEHGDQFFTDELDSEGKLKEPDHRTLTVDLNAAAFTSKLALHYLKKNGKSGGSIVFTASVAGYLASPRMPLYTAAKHGVIGLVRGLRADTAKLNIAVSCVAPGITITPLLNAGEDPLAGRTPEAAAEEIKRSGVAFNRVESVALAVGYLLDEGSKANGYGIFVQNDKFWNMEKGLVKSRSAWMSKELWDETRVGNLSNFNTPSKAKI